MKVIATIASLLLATAATAQQPQNWTSCATGPTQMSVTSFKVTPLPFCIGEQACAEVYGSTSVPIGGEYATFNMMGKFLGRVIYHDNKNLCDVLAAGSMSCPIPANTTYLKFCFNIKAGLPKNINFVWDIRATNGAPNYGDIFCQRIISTAANCTQVA